MLENFAEIFDLVSNANQPKWLSERRKTAIETVRTLGKPHRKLEDWKYTTALGPFLASSYALPSNFDFDESLLAKWIDKEDITILVINGSQVKCLSATPEDSLNLKLLSDSWADGKHWFGESKDDYLHQLRHVFSFLHGAMVQNALSIGVKKDVKIKPKLHLIHVETKQAKDQNHVSAFELHLAMERGAELNLKESFVNLTDDALPYFQTYVSTIKLDTGAQLNHSRIQHHGDTAASIRSLEVEVGKDAVYKNSDIALKGKWSREQIHLKLTQQGAHGQLDAAYIGGSEQYIDYHTKIEHMAANTTSKQLCKGVLGGKARAVFNGVIKIAQDAQQVSADQLNRTLLLSESAEINTKPQMEIDADDVKCSHGATVGQLDEDEVFYLASRGISPHDAKRMLAEGFIAEVFCDDPLVTSHVRHLVKEKLWNIAAKDNT